MIDRHRDQISGTAERTSERRISAPSLEKFSGGTTPSQTVPATLQHYVQGSTIISSSTLLENVMRKPRDFDGELKALQDKARDLKSRKVQRLGELVIATGADSLSVDELAGALIVLTETKDAGKREAWARRGAAFFQSRARRTAPAAERHTGALGRNRAARNRQQAAKARHDMRAWQVERRKRTRHLIELGGLVVKARVVDLTGDDRAIILGALLWMADKLKSNQGEQARALRAAKGKEAFALERATDAPTISQETPQDRA
jgi:hypothetical protein